MKKKCWLALLLCISVVALAADAPKFNFSNPPGKYTVGFRIVDQYDYSRAFQSIDELGQPIKGEVARPIQTLVWYPSEKTSKPHLTYGDYLALAATKDNFTPSAGAVDSAKQAADKLGDAKATVMEAVKDATPSAGSFPVVIYAPSFNAQSFENTDLCEYLASHGYLVIASPSLGAHATAMTNDLNGINAQAGDISFLIGFAHTLPQADLSKVAVAGFSWGVSRTSLPPHETSASTRWSRWTARRVTTISSSTTRATFGRARLACRSSSSPAASPWNSWPASKSIFPEMC